MSACNSMGCKCEARMAIRTIRPVARLGSRGRMYSVVDYDDRTASGVANRYCRTHGLELMTELIRMLVDMDNEETNEDTPAEELAEDGPAEKG
jgi:hypothetical protein